MNDSKYGRLYPERAVAPLRSMALDVLGEMKIGDPRIRPLSEAIDALDELGFPPDEPLFLLRGQDMLAPATIREYALLVEGSALPGREHLEEHADRMEAWHPRKLPD